MTDELFDRQPNRPPERIDLLLALVAEDWKRAGPDQRFFQYVANLAYDLTDSKDAFMVEDDTVIEALRTRIEHRS
ncbi:hypothetical protein [Arthrobacter sp. MDT1-65]